MQSASYFKATEIAAVLTSVKVTVRASEPGLGFETIDGHFIPLEEGEAALHSGKAVLVGGLLVGFMSSSLHEPLASVFKAIL